MPGQETRADSGNLVTMATPHDPQETNLKEICSGTPPPIQTENRTQHEHCRDEQLGREFAHSLTKPTLQAFVEKRPACNSILIDLHPKVTQDAPDIHEIFVRKMGPDKALGLMKEICEELGMPSPQTLMEGCLELVFDDMTPQQAQATLDAFLSGRLQQKLAKVILGDEADRYNLVVKVAKRELENVIAGTRTTEGAAARQKIVFQPGLLLTHDWGQLHTEYGLLDTVIIEAQDKDYQTVTFPITNGCQYEAFVSGKVVGGVDKIKGCPLRFLSYQVPSKATREVSCCSTPKSGVVKMLYRVTHATKECQQALADDAIKELGNIDEKFEAEGKAPKDDVSKFFQKFGSHYQCGVQELCECFTWLVVCEHAVNINILEEIADEIFTIFKDNEAYFPASKEGIWYSPLNMLESESWSTEKRQVLESIKVRIAQCGKSVKRVTLQEWIDCKETHQLSRLSSINDNIVSAWDMLEKTVTAEKVVSMLKEGWNQLVESSHHTEVSIPNDIQSIRIPRLSTWKAFVKELGIQQHFPCKLQLQQVRSLRTIEARVPSKKALPWRVLQQLMLMNSQCREDEITAYAATVNIKPVQKFGQMKGKKAVVEKDVEVVPHPMDVMLLVFTCSDYMLRQSLAQKLYMCRLAIPFIVPTADGSLEMLLWPLRSIILEWRNKEQQPMEEALVTCKCNMVTLMRYGSTTVSKSKMINSILSSSGHASFFNKEVANGKERRLISNGLVELCHFLPACNQKDSFAEPALFFNLRGDACTCPVQQGLMMDLATVIVIWVDIDELTSSDIAKLIHNTMKKKSHVVTVLTNTKGHDEKKIDQLQDTFSRLVGDAIEDIEVVTTFEMDGTAKIITDVNQKVQIAIAKKMGENPKTSLAEFVSSSTKCAVDESINPSCRAGKDCASDIMSQITALTVEKRKEKLLPQQGDHLYEIGTLLRKLHRSTGKSSSFEKEKHKEDMLSLRRKQSEASSGNALMEKVIAMFQDYKQSDKTAFAIRWLQLKLDAISRATLPQLQKKKNQLWNELMKARTDDNAPLTQSLEMQMREVERKIASATFGLEHLVREMAQLYEVAADLTNLTCKSNKFDLHALPELVGQLLLEGHPIELMDGDHGFIPIGWVKAVFHSLARIVGQDKKIFVLSVMGIQSSGKSTLLNTMFGLEFAVSAGRCTRGIYAQLLSVSEESHLPFDYMLVLDSEGLRSHEVGQQNCEHDNELATLVVGLADLALINMKGENTMEITDVLQIVIHAFLRMKLADSAHKRQCMFLHQNVAAVNAQEKLAADRQKFQEKLNDITKEAYEAQGIPQVMTTFSRVISFDGERDVIYFPDLWHGEPPMAVVNQGYSDQASAAKQRILVDAAKICPGGITIPDFTKRVSDMWDGLLTDDFVFSFRNSLAVKVYIDLERRVSQLSMQVEEDILHWVNNLCNIQIQRCKTEKDLVELHERLSVSLKKTMAEILQQNLIALEDFFATHTSREVMYQWKLEKETAFRKFGEAVQVQLQIKLDNMKTCKVLELQSTHHQLEQKIMEKATALAEEMHGKHPSSWELTRRFDELWHSLTDHLSAAPQASSNVLYELENLLCDAMATAGNSKFLKDQMKRTPLVADESLKEITAEDITDDCIMLTAWAHKLKHNKAAYLDDAAAKANEILEHVRTHVDRIHTQDIMFDQHHEKQVIDLITTGVASHNELQNENFSFTAQFTAMLLIRATCHAAAKFTDMNDRFEERHGIKTKLKAYRQRVLLRFTNAVTDASDEVTVSDDFCEAIKVSLVEHIRMDLDKRVLAEVYKAVGATKYDLITKILEEVVEKKNYEKLKKYIHNPIKYANAWVQEFGGNLIFGQDHGASRYCKAANYFVETMFTKMQTSTKRASELASQHEGSDPYNVWKMEFMRQMKGVVPLESTQLKVTTKTNQITIRNFENYQKILETKLQRLKREIIKDEFQEVTAKSIGWFDVVSPFQKAFERLWGCPEVCPFCGEPCQHTDPGHKVPHRCIQHRPPGVLGTRNKDSNLLSMETCSIRVSSPKIAGKNIFGTFSCMACKGLCRKTKYCNTVGKEQDFHSYREYKKYLPDWDIAPDPADVAPKFWQWVICNFQKELQQEYTPCKVSMPGSWKNCTRKDAISSLRLYAQ